MGIESVDDVYPCHEGPELDEDPLRLVVRVPTPHRRTVPSCPPPFQVGQGKGDTDNPPRCPHYSSDGRMDELNAV